MSGTSMQGALGSFFDHPTEHDRLAHGGVPVDEPSRIIQCRQIIHIILFAFSSMDHPYHPFRVLSKVWNAV